MSVAAACDDAAAQGARPAECLRWRRRRLRRVAADYAYILPALAVMLLVIGYPIYDTIYLSFFATPPNLAMSRQDLRRLRQLHAYPRQRRASSASPWNTFIWTFFSTIISFVLGFGAALALNREFVGRGLLRGILLIPYVVSAVAASYVWRWLYHSDFGVIGALSVALGITDQPDHLPRQRQHGAAVADRGEYLEGILRSR